jgi:hypothetical protein
MVAPYATHRRVRVGPQLGSDFQVGEVFFNTTVVANEKGVAFTPFGHRWSA